MNTLDLKEDFQVIIPGTVYNVPNYKVTEDGLSRTGTVQQIQFVRGSVDADEEVTAHSGTLHEHLLAMMIADLQHKNELVPSREGSLVITKLQEAQGWLRQRQIDRTQRGVKGTYKK